MGDFWQDTCYGLRTLRRSPGFTTVAVLTLALGIGANTALFQIFDAVCLRRLPVQHPEQLVEINLEHQGWYAGHSEGRYPVLTNPLWEQIRERQQAFSGAFAWGTDVFDLARGGEARYAQGLWVSGEFFHVLGVQPHLGRVFTPADDRKGCGADGAVISYRFWQREFGGEASAVGRTLSLNGHRVEVIGITPEAFFGVERGRTFDVAVPLCSEPIIKGETTNLERRNSWWLAAMGRLKQGWSVSQASAHLEQISSGIFEATLPPVYQKELAEHYLKFKLRALAAATGISALREQYEIPLDLLLATTGVVLLIACANLANLLLARGSARQREIAVRLALGAARGRLVRQLLTESLLLVMAGTCAGVLLAQWLVEFLVALLHTEGNPLFVDLAVDIRVIAFTGAAAALTCALFGLAPALHATRTAPGSIIRAAGRGPTERRERFGLRRVLVISQVALSLVLLLGALLFTRTLGKLLVLDAGFRQDGILIVNLNLTHLQLPVERRQAFKAELAEQIRHLPGVESAAESLLLPWGDYHNNVVRGDGTEATAPIFQTSMNYVAPGYFHTLEIPLLAGRDFDARDSPTSAKVAIVNEAFARRLLGASPRQDWRNERRHDAERTKQERVNPVGKVFFMRSFGDPAPVAYQIVGLVKNAKYQDLREDFPRTVYFARSQEPAPDAFGEVVVRSNAPLASLVRSIKGRIAEAGPEIVVEFHVLRSQVRESLLRERLMATLSGFFGFLAALLAAIGVYGVMSYSVLQRTSEIGIRMALGADPRKVLVMVLREVMSVLAIGLAIGTAIGLAAARSAAALLFGLKPHDPLTLAIAVVLLAGVAVAAGYLPARMASRLDPLTALRHE